MDLGAFPALVPGKGVVQGVVLEVDDDAVVITGRIEGYEPSRGSCLDLRKRVTATLEGGETVTAYLPIRRVIKMTHSRFHVVRACLALGVVLSGIACSLEVPVLDELLPDGGADAAQPAPEFPEPASVWQVVALDSTMVLVVFTEPMVDETAMLGFYRISPSLMITGVVLSPDKRSVTLTTALQADEEYTLLIGPVQAADGGLLDGGSRSVVFFGIASHDTRPPQVAIAVVSDSTTVRVAFSEPVDARAENVTSYRIVTTDSETSSLMCLSAELSPSGTEVKLTTAPQANVEYRLTVSNVADLSGNEIDASANSVIFDGIGETSWAEFEPPRVVGAISTSNITVLVSFSKMMG